MASTLDKKLNNIEEALGGERFVPTGADKLGEHLDYIEYLIEQGGGGGGSEVPTFEASTFNFNPPEGTFELELAEEDISDIIENAYPIIKISYAVNDNTIVWPFILSTSQASVSVVYISVVSVMNVRFLLDFALQAGQIVTTGAAMINTSTIADIKVDNTSVVDQTGNVNLVTKTAYNASTNKLATEADLGGGGSVYMHKLTFTSNEDQHIIVYTSSSTPFTSNTWYWWLRNNGFTNKTNCLPIILNDKSISKSGDTTLIVHSGLYASANSPYCTRFETHLNITPGTGIGSITYDELSTTPNRDIVIEM